MSMDNIVRGFLMVNSAALADRNMRRSMLLTVNGQLRMCRLVPSR